MSTVSTALKRTSREPLRNWTYVVDTIPAVTTITTDRRSCPGIMATVEHPANALVTRVGNGYDSHRYGPGVPLILGGVTIPSDVGLIGHSDGDAVAHAVTDAVLGACGAGDIGEMFSDTDPGNRGRDSIEMLRLAVDRVNAKGWVVQQVDVTVIAQFPKISPYRPSMRVRLAEALGVKTGQLFGAGAVRAAVTCRLVGPPLFETMEALGVDTVRRRLDAAIERLSLVESAR